jgi:AmiR/NasT family two-component response regulator
LEDFKILIVEDELLVSVDLKHILESMDYDVIGSASSGEEAISIAGKTMLKGDLDGIETAVLIHNLYDIPIVYLTAYHTSEILERAKKAEPYGYIVKPFNEFQLHSTIEIACYNHSKGTKIW